MKLLLLNAISVENLIEDTKQILYLQLFICRGIKTWQELLMS